MIAEIVADGDDRMRPSQMWNIHYEPYGKTPCLLLVLGKVVIVAFPDFFGPLFLNGKGSTCGSE